MKRILITIAMITLSGCSLGSTAHVGEHFTLSGTPEGVRAFGDTLIGALKTSKEQPSDDNQYLKTRRHYETNVTARQLNKPKSFIEKLFAQDVTDENTVQQEGAGS